MLARPRGMAFHILIRIAGRSLLTTKPKAASSKPPDTVNVPGGRVIVSA